MHEIFGSIRNQFLVDIKGIFIDFSSEDTSTEHIMRGNASAYYIEQAIFSKRQGCCKLDVIPLPFLLPHIFASPWSNHIIVCGIRNLGIEDMPEAAPVL